MQLPTPPPLTIAAFAYEENFTPEDSHACELADLIVSLGGCDLEALASLIPAGKPSLCVLGPRDGSSVPHPFQVLHANGFNFRGWRIAGLSGSLLTNRGSMGHYITEVQAGSLLENLPASDIFFTHAPPGGMDEVEVAGVSGIISIREYLDMKSPIYHFWANPEDSTAVEYHDTMIVGVRGRLTTPPLQFL